MSLVVPPPKLVEEIGVRPDRVRNGKIRDWGNVEEDFWGGEERRARARMRGIVDGNFGKRLEVFSLMNVGVERGSSGMGDEG